MNLESLVDAAIIVFFSFHMVVLALLFVYGLNILYLAWVAHRRREGDPPLPPMPDMPHVTVQIPVYNERYVVRRTLEAVCALEWERDKLQIQILDDSTDDTSVMVAALVAQQQALGLNIQHIRRRHRHGYKAGALAHGLATATGEFVAIFDADFVPQADFLRKTIPHFLPDPRLGFVQTRWGYLNGDYSLFAKLQALSIDGHFIIEQFARQRSGLMMNFNGTGGVWRRAAIDDAGGWQATTLTEDLDLSYRAELRGWKPLYLRDVVVEGEIPITATAYRRQQYRWARGSWECAMRLIPQIWRADLPRWTKIQATLHLSGYAIHVLMLTLALMYPLLILITTENPLLLTILVAISAMNITATAPTIYYTFAQHEKGERWQKHFKAILLLNVMGAGIMVNNTRAILHAMFAKRAAVFERTPKFGIADNPTAGQGDKRAWTHTPYNLKVSPQILLEIVMLFYNLLSVGLSIYAGNFAIFFYASVFAIGLAFMLGLTAWQSWQILRAERQQRRISATSIERARL